MNSIEFFCSAKSFRNQVHKKMIHLSTEEAFGLQSVNILLRIYISIELASHNNDSVHKLLEIGLVCDHRRVAFHKDIFPKCLCLSKPMFDEITKRESINICDFSKKKLSGSFESLVGQDNIKNWRYFQIPLTQDGHHLYTLIRVVNCKILSLFSSIDLPGIKLKFPQISQKIYENTTQDKRVNLLVNENGIKNCMKKKIVFREIKTPCAVPNENQNGKKTNPNEEFFVVNVIEEGESRYPMKIDKNEPTLPSIFDENQVKWFPFIG